MVFSDSADVTWTQLKIVFSDSDSDLKVHSIHLKQQTGYKRGEREGTDSLGWVKRLPLRLISKRFYDASKTYKGKLII